MVLKIADLPVSEKPREKALLLGIRSLSSRELLAILLRTGYKGYSALDVADDILKQANGLSGFARMNQAELLKIRGIGVSKALELQACLEISRRIALENIKDTDVLQHPENVVKWLQNEIGTSDQENFLAIYLNNRNCVISHRLLFTGTINMSLVFPREIFREAIINKANKVIVVHNHPSRDLTPSHYDIELTNKLIEASKLMNIELADHIIVSDQDWFSFLRAGLMN